MRRWLKPFIALTCLASIGLASTGLAGIVSGPAGAAEKGLSDKGEVLVRENCARCHAIGATGDSPNADAPAFRTLSKNYPIESLAEALAEGIVTGHPDMPVFVFKPHQVDAILAYLESIQEQPSAPE